MASRGLSLQRLKPLVSRPSINDFVTIKEKTSHSSCDQHSGELNDVSRYLYQGPAKVANQAKELQAIRRKHQNDDSFDFVATSYLTKEVRIADHDNGR